MLKMSQLDVPDVHCRHDDLTLDDRDIRLMRAYSLWLETVRASGVRHSSTWSPSDIDIAQSHLFWRIRMGDDPLPYPPPCICSSPWYELIVAGGDHDAGEVHVSQRTHRWGVDRLIVSQELYDIIEKISETEYIAGYGPYRFRVFRDVERHIESMNGKHGAANDAIRARAESNPSVGWFLRREKGLETDPKIRDI